MRPDLLSDIWSAQQAPVLSAHEWESLLRQGRASRLLARLAVLYDTRGWTASVPPAVVHHLRSAIRYTDVLQRDVMLEVDHVMHALQGVDTPVVLLKGAAYLAARLPPAQGRLFSDIDILVRHDKLRDVELALFAAGWIAEKLKPYDDRYYRQWMHELPPLQHVGRRTTLDVHHTLAPPTSRFVVAGADMLARSLPLEGSAWPQLRTLAPTDMVLHSALHLMQEGEFHAGLRDLLDLRDLLQHFGQHADFWPALAARARITGLEKVLAHVLAQIQRMWGLQAPASAGGLARPRPAGAGAALVQVLLPRVLAPSDPAGDNLSTRLARELMYVRSHWLRMPWYQIVPHLLRKAWQRTAERIAQPKAAP